MTRPTRKEALDWAKAGEPTPKVLAWSPQPPPLECTKCGGPIDEKDVALHSRIAQRARPGEPIGKPKVCTACLWKALRDLDDDKPAKVPITGSTPIKTEG